MKSMWSTSTDLPSICFSFRSELEAEAGRATRNPHVVAPFARVARKALPASGITILLIHRCHPAAGPPPDHIH